MAIEEGLRWMWRGRGTDVFDWSFSRRTEISSVESTNDHDSSFFLLHKEHEAKQEDESLVFVWLEQSSCDETFLSNTNLSQATSIRLSSEALRAFGMVVNRSLNLKMFNYFWELWLSLLGLILPTKAEAEGHEKLQNPHLAVNVGVKFNVSRSAADWSTMQISFIFADHDRRRCFTAKKMSSSEVTAKKYGSRAER